MAWDTPPERITNAVVTLIVFTKRTIAFSGAIRSASRLRLERPNEQVFEIDFIRVPPHPPRRIFSNPCFVVFLRRHRADDAIDRAPNSSRKGDEHCNHENGNYCQNDAVLGHRLPLLTHQEQMQT